MGRAIVNIVIEQWVNKGGLYVLLSKQYKLNNKITYDSCIEDFTRIVDQVMEFEDFLKLKENPLFKVLNEEEYKQLGEQEINN